MEAVALHTTALPTTAIKAFVSTPASGGIVLFVGTVRNHTRDKAVQHLFFEAYQPMALAEMKKIVEAAKTQWPLHKMAIHHRLGDVAIGEAAVVIACSSTHRQAAFEACAYAIDTLKETVPIWKKEIFEDGEVWVSAHP